MYRYPKVPYGTLLTLATKAIKHKQQYVYKHWQKEMFLVDFEKSYLLDHFEQCKGSCIFRDIMFCKRLHR